MLSLPGTPRTSAEAYDDSPKYKQIKRESPPIRSFDGGIGKGKPYDGVNTIQEPGRSIHEIPRQDQSGGDSRKTPDMADRRVLEGSMSQVRPRLQGLVSPCVLFSRYARLYSKWPGCWEQPGCGR